MTYATLREGVFLLFEGPNPVNSVKRIDQASNIAWRTYWEWKVNGNDLISKASEGAIVASDQEQVRELIAKKCTECLGTGVLNYRANFPDCQFCAIDEGQFKALEGYRIEVNERAPSEMEMYAYKSQENIKLATLVKK